MKFKKKIYIKELCCLCFFLILNTLQLMKTINKNNIGIKYIQTTGER